MTVHERIFWVADELNTYIFYYRLINEFSVNLYQSKSDFLLFQSCILFKINAHLKIVFIYNVDLQM